MTKYQWIGSVIDQRRIEREEDMKKENRDYLKEGEHSDDNFPNRENSSSEDEEVKNLIRSLPTTPVSRVRKIKNHIRSGNRNKKTSKQEKQEINININKEDLEAIAQEMPQSVYYIGNPDMSKQNTSSNEMSSLISPVIQVKNHLSVRYYSHLKNPTMVKENYDYQLQSLPPPPHISIRNTFVKNRKQNASANKCSNIPFTLKKPKNYFYLVHRTKLSSKRNKKQGSECIYSYSEITRYFEGHHHTSSTRHVTAWRKLMMESRPLKILEHNILYHFANICKFIEKCKPFYFPFHNFNIDNGKPKPKGKNTLAKENTQKKLFKLLPPFLIKRLKVYSKPKKFYTTIVNIPETKTCKKGREIKNDNTNCDYIDLFKKQTFKLTFCIFFYCKPIHFTTIFSET